MVRQLKVIEVPFYILVIGLSALERGNIVLASALFLVSFIRLWLNSLNDNSLNDGQRN